MPEAPGERPDRQRLFIPGDVSSAAMIRSMAASSGRGIMFETEADTLSQTLEKDWATAESALIDKRVYPHLLRHTIATRLVNQGMPIASVQQFLGHEDLKTIQLYAKTETRTMQRDFERAMEAS